MKLTSVEIHQVSSSTKSVLNPGTPIGSPIYPHEGDSSGELPTGSAEVVVLSFRDPRRLNPYNVKALIGLDVDDIVPRFYGVAGKSENKYYSLTMEKRTVVVRIQLNPNFGLNESYSDLRDYLYKFIASTRSGIIQLRFKNGANVVAVITGMISKFEAALSDKEPEVQVTVSCMDPWLRAPDRLGVDISGFDPAFTIITDELSTAPHGFRFEMSFTGTTPSFEMTDVSADGGLFIVTPVGGFDVGDVLHFSSEIGNRYLYVLRDEAPIYLADAMDPTSVWPIIFPGENTYSIAPSEYMNWDKITYYPTYWGV